MDVIRSLKSGFFVPGHLAVIGSLFDFAGPKVSLRYRKALFRLFGGILAASFYRRVSGFSRIHALLGGSIAGVFYRLKTHGLANLPERGFLLVANHMGLFDAVLLQLAIPRPIRFIAKQSICEHRWLNPVFNLIGRSAIPLCPGQSKKAIREAVVHLKNGDIVCVYPEGELSRNGLLLRLQSGFELISRLAKCEVVPVWLDGLRDSFISFERGKKLFNFHSGAGLNAVVAFGKPISGGGINNGMVRQKLLELNEFCFQQRPELDANLARASVRGLKSRPFDGAFIDGSNGRSVKRAELLGTSIALSRWIKRKCPDKRVALILSEGADLIVANLAVALANKIPVTLDSNASSGAANLTSQFSDVITAGPLMKRVSDFRRAKGVYPVEEVISRLKAKILFWQFFSFFTPARMLCDLLQLPREGGTSEAAISFKSSPAGDLTGMVRTHRNLMASVAQLRLTLRLEPQDWLAAVPFSQCDTGILTLWYPVIEGIRIAVNISPEVVLMGPEVLARLGITVLATTPAFVRQLLSGAEAKDLADLKILTIAAEELSTKLEDAFIQKFGKRIFAGYMLPETGAVASMNLPEPPKAHPQDNFQPSFRSRSVGKLVPGQVGQIRHPETGVVLSPYETGMLWLRGANIVESYFNQPEKSHRVIRDGWLQTGHLARFDQDGFLYIEGCAGAIPEITGTGACTENSAQFVG